MRPELRPSPDTRSSGSIRLFLQIEGINGSMFETIVLVPIWQMHFLTSW